MITLIMNRKSYLRFILILLFILTGVLVFIRSSKPDPDKNPNVQPESTGVSGRNFRAPPQDAHTRPDSYGFIAEDALKNSSGDYSKAIKQLLAWGEENPDRFLAELLRLSELAADRGLGEEEPFLNAVDVLLDGDLRASVYGRFLEGLVIAHPKESFQIAKSRLGSGANRRRVFYKITGTLASKNPHLALLLADGLDFPEDRKQAISGLRGFTHENVESAISLYASSDLSEEGSSKMLEIIASSWDGEVEDLMVKIGNLSPNQLATVLGEIAPSNPMDVITYSINQGIELDGQLVGRVSAGLVSGGSQESIEKITRLDQFKGQEELIRGTFARWLTADTWDAANWLLKSDLMRDTPVRDKLVETVVNRMAREGNPGEAAAWVSELNSDELRMQYEQRFKK